ncbi:MAG: Zn(2+)-responsive transcriptional regulator [Rheinheimera sp.]|uniref:Zn(2+)-responsive transcriptional regulator n=1 Tax=Arsukibacterium sp. UBA3155 TaxID=1946058 RepID=UPI000C8D8588|nr:Zn(2+)-responsive transcriptional regulator [Arsukibacterium sp. UBA3155]MAD75491.1 Zn(2+)-responsive transcriptional regulator [Rheinheimera sp.]|tara:strand:- start:102428 stop:102880 length:453 start_codon:yes stop_codon:yes gene_type:complete
MKIGELVKRHGISVDTIRFYEKQQLLRPSARSDAGYRLYSETDSQRLAFILRAKSVGFSLQQINELLQIEDNKSQWQCSDVKDKVQQKLREIARQLAELSQFQQALQQLDEACCGGSISANECSILTALEQDSTVKPEQHAGEQHNKEHN